MGAVGLLKGLTDCGGHDRVPALRDVGQGVAHPVNPAPLPSRLKDPGDGSLEACMGIADHQLHPVEPATAQRSQKVGPERLSFRWTNA